MSTEVAVQQQVAAHIERAERIAAQRDVSRLTDVQRLVRQLLLEELERYRLHGQFPRNPDFAVPTPYFVDAQGTRCAMAHLLELGGERALVQRIAAQRNNAFVRELADEPQLLAWLEAAGLSVAEAAAIQPTYPCETLSACVCGRKFAAADGPPAKGVLEGIVTDAGTVTVQRVYGDGLGYEIGDSVGIEESLPTNARVLLPLRQGQYANEADAGAVVLKVLPLGAGDLYTCSYPEGAPGLTADQYSEAMTSATCHETLYAQDARWKDGCGPLGCNVTGDASLGILLALVGALVRRRVG